MVMFRIDGDSGSPEDETLEKLTSHFYPTLVQKRGLHHDEVSCHWCECFIAGNAVKTLIKIKAEKGTTS